MKMMTEEEEKYHDRTMCVWKKDRYLSLWSLASSLESDYLLQGKGGAAALECRNKKKKERKKERKKKERKTNLTIYVDSCTYAYAAWIQNLTIMSIWKVTK